MTLFDKLEVGSVGRDFTEADLLAGLEKVAETGRDYRPACAPDTLSRMDPAAHDPGPTMRTPEGQVFGLPVEVNPHVPEGMVIVTTPEDRLIAQLRAKLIVAEENARDAREAYERAIQRRQSSSPSH